MGKYTWPTILGVVGSILLFYGWQKESTGGVFDAKRAYMSIGGILVATAGIIVVIGSQSK